MKRISWFRRARHTIEFFLGHNQGGFVPEWALNIATIQYPYRTGHWKVGPFTVITENTIGGDTFWAAIRRGGIKVVFDKK